MQCYINICMCIYVRSTCHCRIVRKLSCQNEFDGSITKSQWREKRKKGITWAYNTKKWGFRFLIYFFPLVLIIVYLFVRERNQAPGLCSMLHAPCNVIRRLLQMALYSFFYYCCLYNVNILHVQMNWTIIIILLVRWYHVCMIGC